MTFETERLTLRPWTEADAQSLYRHASDPDIGPAAGWPAHTSVEESRHIIQAIFSTKPYAYAVCLKPGNEPIGAIEIKLTSDSNMAQADDECELGYWIGKPYWGQGLIPEAAREMLRFAFEELGMSRVYCGHYDGNLKSKRVQEKLGFKHVKTVEGVELKLLNEVRTDHISVLTKDEWDGRKEH